jgi:hypothetical protein
MSTTTTSNTGNNTNATNKPKQTLKEDIIIRGIKIIDIGYITVLYFILGFTVSIWFNRMYEKYVDLINDYKSNLRLAIELLIHIWLLGITVYIARNIVEKIPSPLDNLYGFSHKRVKELHSATVFTLVFFFSQTYMREKMGYLYKRLTGKATQKKRSDPDIEHKILEQNITSEDRDKVESKIDKNMSLTPQDNSLLNNINNTLNNTLNNTNVNNKPKNNIITKVITNNTVNNANKAHKKAYYLNLDFNKLDF